MRMITQIVILMLGVGLLGCGAKYTTGESMSIGMPLPSFNTSDLRAVYGGDDGATLQRDDLGLVRELETVLLPETKITIREVRRQGVWIPVMYAIETADYPSSKATPLWVDERMIIPTVNGERKSGGGKLPPSRERILSRMESLVGTPYVWGGNWPKGLPGMLKWYPPHKSLDDATKTAWTMAGVDCSGLLYWATDGHTPRNTSQLVTFGKPVDIAGKSANEIVTLVQPLDIIVWPGHVLIVLDNERVIESRFKPDSKTDKSGVRIAPLLERLTEIATTRRPANGMDPAKRKTQFVLRRWK